MLTPTVTEIRRCGGDHPQTVCEPAASLEGPRARREGIRTVMRAAHAANLTWSAPMALDTTGGGLTPIDLACPTASQCTAVDGFGAAPAPPARRPRWASRSR
jgi:hypothetical protein